MKKLPLSLDTLAVESFQIAPTQAISAPRTLSIECCNSCGAFRCPPPLTNTVECA